MQAIDSCRTAQRSPWFLLIEDDPSVAKTIATLIAKESGSVHVAPTLAKAASLLETAEPDGVIADLKIPDGCGLQFCAARRRTSLARSLVVVYTGGNLISDETAVASRNRFEVLLKPIPRDIVASFARRAIAGSEDLDFETRLTAAERWIAGDVDLTFNEKRLFHLVTAGMRRGELPTALSLSDDYVKNLVRAVIRKVLGEGTKADVKDVRIAVLLRVLRTRRERWAR